MPSEQLVPLTLIVGDEELLVARGISAVVAQAREHDPEAELLEADSGQVQPGELSDLLSPSLFAQTRVLVLRAAQDLSEKAAGELAAILADPIEGCAVVAVHAGGQKGKALLASLTSAAGRTVAAAGLKRPAERREFVRAELRRDGRLVEEEAVTALLDAVGSELRELASAAEQLLSDTDGAIDVEAVGRYHRGRAESSGFAVADRAVDGDLAGALELVRWWSRIKLEHVLVTSAMASTLRSMAMVASAGRGPVGAIAGQVGMPTWKVEKTQRQVRGWRPEGLVAAVQAAARADGEVKGAAADADHAVERMLMAVVQARGAGH